MILILKIILNHLQNINSLWYIMPMNKFIKTECGLNKYEDLKSSKTFFGRVRFYWFVFIASLRDKILKF